MKLYLTILAIIINIYDLNATNVGGNISENTIWNKSNSPYYLTSDIKIEKGATLEIEPGVVLYCSNGGYSSDRREYDIRVSGVLRAIGNAEDSIIFDTYPGEATGSWGDLFINDSTFVDSSKFEYCHFKRIGNGIICNNSAPVFNHCYIEGGGMYFSGDSSLVPIISYCVVKNNQKAIVTSCSPLITYSIIQGGGNSVACLNQSKAELHYNDIYSPMTSSGEREINAENNYWGAATEDSILLLHRFHNVDYTPWLADKHND